MKKRLGALLLCFVLLATTLLAACNKTPAEPEAPAGEGFVPILRFA